MSQSATVMYFITGTVKGSFSVSVVVMPENMYSYITCPAQGEINVRFITGLNTVRNYTQSNLDSNILWLIKCTLWVLCWIHNKCTRNYTIYLPQWKLWFYEFVQWWWQISNIRAWWIFYSPSTDDVKGARRLIVETVSNSCFLLLSHMLTLQILAHCA